MIDKKYVELINKDIDGLLSEKESGQLTSYLKQHQEARTYHHDLKNMANRLQNTPAVEPSGNLKKHVMNSISKNKYKAKERSVTTLFSSIRFNMKYAYAFSLGLLIGLSLLTLNKLNSPDQSNLTGTLLINPDKPSNLLSTDVSTDEVQGTIRVKNSNNLVTLETLFNSEQQGNLKIQFEPAELKFMQFSQLIDSALNVDIKEGLIQFNYPAGNNGYATIFQNKTPYNPMVSVSLQNEGVTIFEKQISITRN